MLRQRTTTIAGREIPIIEGDPSVVRFSGGRRRKSEAGSYEFWTILGKRAKSTARSLAGTDPGERFRRMAKSEADADSWQIAVNANIIRPATEEEVIGWLKIKPGDSPFAEFCQIGSKKTRIVKAGRGLAFEHGEWAA